MKKKKKIKKVIIRGEDDLKKLQNQKPNSIDIVEMDMFSIASEIAKKYAVPKYVQFFKEHEKAVIEDLMNKIKSDPKKLSSDPIEKFSQLLSQVLSDYHTEIFNNIQDEIPIIPMQYMKDIYWDVHNSIYNDAVRLVGDNFLNGKVPYVWYSDEAKNGLGQHLYTFLRNKIVTSI